MSGKSDSVMAQNSTGLIPDLGQKATKRDLPFDIGVNEYLFDSVKNKTA